MNLPSLMKNVLQTINIYVNKETTTIIENKISQFCWIQLTTLNIKT